MLAAYPKYSRSNTGQRVPTRYQYTDLFEFAQSGGKQAFEHVQQMPKTEAYVNVRIAAMSSVEIIFCDHQIVEWKFCGKRDSKRHELEDMRQLVVKLYNESSEESTEVSELVFAKTSSSSYCCTSNCTTKVVQFIRYICTLFNAPVRDMRICPSKLHHLEEIQSVEVLKKSTCVTILKGVVSHEEMRRVLGGFESAYMTILCDTEPNFTYDRTISIKDLSVHAGSWFQGPMLLNLVNCETVYLMGSQISDEHLNIFLHEWFQKSSGCGTITRLAMFPGCLCFDCENVYEPSSQKEWDLDKITQGLSSFQQPSPQWSGLGTRRFRRTIDDTIIDISIAGCGFEFHGTR